MRQQLFKPKAQESCVVELDPPPLLERIFDLGKEVVGEKTDVLHRNTHY